MNITLAAFHVVHDHPGGAAVLGPMLGKNPATLSHEVNPNYPTAKLGVEDALKLTQLTGDLRMLTAFAAQSDCMLIPLASASEVDGSMELVAATAREFADLVQSISAATADGSVTPNELKRVETEASQLVACVQRAVQHVSALAQGTRQRQGVAA